MRDSDGAVTASGARIGRICKVVSATKETWTGNRDDIELGVIHRTIDCHRVR